MAEPTTSAAAASSLLAPALLTVFLGLDPAIVFAAFSGSVVFVLYADDTTTLRKLVLLVPSFGGGIISAPLVTSALRLALPATIEVSVAFGALIASALVVKTLNWLLANDPGKLLSALRGGKPQ